MNSKRHNIDGVGTVYKQPHRPRRWQTMNRQNVTDNDALDKQLFNMQILVQ